MYGMDPLRIYDYLTLARQKVFDCVRPLSVEQYGSVLPIGLGTLGRTLTHIMICEWFYVQRIEERVVPPYDQWPIQDEKPPPFTVLEPTWIEQAKQTQAALTAVRDWDAAIEYRTLSDDDDDPPKIVTTCAADLFTQLMMHEVHHRAQALNILRQLGVAIEDIDFNALMYQRREVVDV